MSSNSNTTPPKQDNSERLMNFKNQLDFIFKEAQIKRIQAEKEQFLEEIQHQEDFNEILKHHSLSESFALFIKKFSPFTAKKAWILLENNIQSHSQEEVISALKKFQDSALKKFQETNKEHVQSQQWIFHLEKNGIDDVWSPFMAIIYDEIKDISLEENSARFCKNYRNILSSSLHKKQWKSVDALLHPSFLEEQETIDMIFNEDPVLMCFKTIVKKMPSSDIERFVQDHVTLNRAFRKYCHDEGIMHWVDFKTSCIQKEILHNQMQSTQIKPHIPKRL